MAEATCSQEGCDKRVQARDLCSKHYEQARKAGFTEAVRPGPKPKGRRCSLPGCDAPHKGHGYCKRHLEERVRTGQIERGVCGGPECGRPAISESLGLCDTHASQFRRGRPLTVIRERKARSGPCRGPECGRVVVAGGLCSAHYWQQSQGRDLTPIRQPAPQEGDCPACTAVGEQRAIESGCGGYCQTHYRRRLRNDPEWDRPIAPKAPNGSVWTDPASGYRYLTIDGRQVREHRLVMERVLGRPLLPHENVHHLNGARGDNRPENLELWSTWQPSGQRVPDKVAYAREVLALYGTAEERALFT